jgi:hypothetical protein
MFQVSSIIIKHAPRVNDKIALPPLSSTQDHTDPLAATMAQSQLRIPRDPVEPTLRLICLRLALIDMVAVLYFNLRELGTSCYGDNGKTCTKELIRAFIVVFTFTHHFAR